MHSAARNSWACAEGMDRAGQREATEAYEKWKDLLEKEAGLANQWMSKVSFNVIAHKNGLHGYVLHEDEAEHAKRLGVLEQMEVAAGL